MAADAANYKKRAAAGAAGCVEGLYRERFLGLTGPMGRRVLKFDGPLARGLWYRPQGDEYKVNVTGLAFCIIWHEKHSADWLAALATPYPGCAGLPPMQGAE